MTEPTPEHARIRQTIDTCESDRAYVQEFQWQIGLLCGMVVEATRDHPVYLLSPHMREMLAEKAQQVKNMLFKLSGRIAFDNPGEPL